MEPMNRRFLLHALTTLLTLGIGVALFIWFFRQYELADTLSTLKAVGILPLVGFVGISLVNFALLGWRWYLAVKAQDQDHHNSYWDVLRHRMSGYAISYLTPAAQVGGEPLRIALLHQNGMPLATATSSVILDVVFELLGFVLYIGLGLLVSLATHVLPGELSLIIGVSLLLIGGGILLFLSSAVSGQDFFSLIWRKLIPIRFKRLHAYEERMRHVESLMHNTLKQTPKLIMQMTVLSLVTVAFRGVEVVYLGHLLGQSLTLVEAVLLSSLPGLVLLIPIPSALGILEGSTAGIVNLLGIPLNPIAMVLLIRFRDVVFILLGVVHMGQRLRAWLERRIIRPVSRVVHRRV